MWWKDLKLRLDNHYNDEEIYNVLAKINCSNHSRAAILVGLFEHAGEIYTILTKRSYQLKAHSGEVCFPGGKVDKDDKDLFHTALRESWEEIGLEASHVKMLGQLMPMVAKSGIIVFPIVALITNMENIFLNINSDEVDDIFACPLHFFLDYPPKTIDFPFGQYYSYTWVKDDTMQQEFENSFLQQVLSDCKCDNHNIFGLTAMYCIMIAGFCLNKKTALNVDIDKLISNTLKYVDQRVTDSPRL